MGNSVYYQKARVTLPIIQKCVPIPLNSTSEPTLPETKWQWVLLLMKRFAQSFRLMVGVQDYENYCLHMRSKHPDKVPMSEREFHRYCLEARYPSKGGKVGKCPC
ncbi:YbdD/YjiX family protein [Aquirhabdus parva]|uniref:Putative selenoprotein n=1 Tax=Aquirhabdus parva TaxID=2283318 RepID=A0A345P6W2_9GAMM|nr:CstA-like transporter-associated (seleno)protein [Aquirhabdus parva]AXI03021.1 putative selenoprotein [Aquirhabdus parva]